MENILKKFYVVKLDGKYYHTIDDFVDIDYAIIFSKYKANKIIDKIVNELNVERDKIQLEIVYLNKRTLTLHKKIDVQLYPCEVRHCPFCDSKIFGLCKLQDVEFCKNAKNWQQIYMHCPLNKKMSLEELKKGYELITGCDNVDEFTEEELRTYMAEAMTE